jgi:hypothetical protein
MGDKVRSAYTLRGDDDYGQARVLIRDVMDEPQRERLVPNVCMANSLVLASFISMRKRARKSKQRQTEGPLRGVHIGAEKKGSGPAIHFDPDAHSEKRREKRSERYPRTPSTKMPAQA